MDGWMDGWMDVQVAWATFQSHIVVDTLFSLTNIMYTSQGRYAYFTKPIYCTTNRENPYQVVQVIPLDIPLHLKTR